MSGQEAGQNVFFNSRGKVFKLTWYVFVLLLICGTALYNRERLPQFGDLAQMNIATLSSVSLLFVLLQTLSGYRMHLICKSYSVEMRPLEWFALIWVKSFFNLLPLNAGVASNAVYLKIRHGFRITSFVNISIQVAIITTMVYAFLGLVFMGLHFMQTMVMVPFLSLLLFGLFLVSVLLLIIPLPRVSSSSKIGRLFNQVRESSEVIRHDRPLLAKMILIQVLHFLLFLGIYSVLFHDLEYALGLVSISIVVIFYNLIQVVTIFPGNLGIREATAGGVSQLLGFSFMDGMLGAVAFGLISISWDVLLGAAFAFWLSRSGSFRE